MASSGLALLLGPLELEYLLCRCCLLFGLVAMLCALGTRAVLQMGLSRAHTPGEQRAGLAVAAIFGGFALALLGYADSTAPGLLRPEAEFAALSSYGPMARRACVLVFHTLASSGWGRASLAAAAVAAGVSVSAFVAARR